MINSKMICKIMGSLFFIEAGFLILCALLAIYSPLPEQAFWIISNQCPTDYFSGEA